LSSGQAVNAYYGETFDHGAGAIGSNNIEVRNNRIMNNNRRGLDIAAGDGAVQENSVGYNGSDGIRSLGVAETANNWVWNNVGNGIVIGANADTLVIGNKSYDNQKSGFVLSSDLPGGLIVGNMALRNNAASVP
jgi:hypothetical protein